LAEAGVTVVGVDLKAPGDQLMSSGDVRYVQTDLTGDNGIAKVLEALPAKERGLDYLVNAAGVAWFDRDGSALDIGDDVWAPVMSLNFDVMRQLSVAAVPHLRRGQGRSMVHVASTAGLRSMDSPLDAYQVSKAAVISLSRALALSLGPDRIRSNTVCPGAVLTPMIEHLYAEDPTRRHRMEDKTPLGRLGTPDDIAATIAFLLSPQSSFITATDVVVDGGWTAQIK
jgi:NAD(P)-dependent dehydrogenase (short-subunit alcohol dehydrogenase family)